MNYPKISIIIPIYRVEPYLRKCVDSVLAQTYKNIEIILVDDDSPDRCGEICDEYAKKDNRVRVIHKENGGLSDARNTGIRIATGDYIMFIDSDDYVANDICEVLLDVCEKNKADISTCGHISVWPDRKTIPTDLDDTGKETVCDNYEALKIYFTENGLKKNKFHTISCAKLYIKSLFDNIQFPFGKLHEDIFTTYKLLYEAKKCVNIDLTKYFYLQRDDSIMSNAFNIKNIEHIIEAFEERYSFFKERSDELAQYAGHILFEYYLYIYKKLILKNTTQGDIENLKKLVENRIRRLSVLSPTMPLRRKHRVWLTFFKINPALYVKINCLWGRIRTGKYE